MISTLSFMTQTCRIAMKTMTPDATNRSPTVTWSAPATDTPCCIQTASAGERDGPPIEAGVQEFNVYFPPGTAVKHTSKLITFGNCPALSSSDVLEVTSATADHGGEGAYVMVTARRVLERGPV